jgi:hypothetical protein
MDAKGGIGLKAVSIRVYSCPFAVESSYFDRYPR